jgi:hypothetical protein
MIGPERRRRGHRWAAAGRDGRTATPIARRDAAERWAASTSGNTGAPGRENARSKRVPVHGERRVNICDHMRMYSTEWVAV